MGCSVAGSIANSINSSSAPVTASVSGSNVNVTAKTTGSATHYSLSVSESNIPPSISISGGMSGGSNGTPVYNSGSVSATIDGVTASYNWGQGSTPASIASGLRDLLPERKSLSTGA
jgi:hypothetical protein